MYKFIRIIPYIIITIFSLITLYISFKLEESTIKNVLVNISSNALFILVAFLFYDLIKSYINKKEKKFLDEYIKNQISNDLLIVLYYLKKIIHGYNLETNTLNNILGIANYSYREIANAVSNQKYIGFQIYKRNDEVRNILKNALNDNFILKYSDHIDVINILKINNTLIKIEFLLKEEKNFDMCSEQAVEFTVLNGKYLNPDNDEKYLLLKKTNIENRMVVYDSGYYDKFHLNKLLNTYVLKKESAKQLATYISDILVLIRYWIPDVVNISKNENRFRIIKNYFSPFTNTKTVNSKIFVADIVDIKSKGES